MSEQAVKLVEVVPAPIDTAVGEQAVGRLAFVASDGSTYEWVEA